MLSYDLAIAIGWMPEQIKPNLTDSVIITCGDGKKRCFCIKDNNTMWEIARRYNAFPHKLSTGQWVVIQGGPAYKTPEEAIARHVIWLLSCENA